MDFSPLQIAVMQRFPVGSVITLQTIGGEKTDHKAKISRWTIHTYGPQQEGGKSETTLAFHFEGAGEVPPTSAAQISENTPRQYNVVHGFDSEENNISTDDYPYGRERCTCRWWVESPTKGSGKDKQRFMQQTINPKNGRVNNPKGSIYHDFQIMYIEGSTGHVKNYPFDVFHGPDGVLGFLATGMLPQLDNDTRARLEKFIKYAKLIRGNQQCWIRSAYLLTIARELIAQRLPAYSPEDVKNLTAKAQEKFPDDQYIYESDTTRALNAALAEQANNYTFDL